ncbi:MAG: gluconate 2-dehydrogenase subunit 3 family protein [Gammaproteobacteria bacterium]|nr:gluconate 2-dehydrogenase subunit 3 family protein [Gammaproteobacteria bacterium]
MSRNSTFSLMDRRAFILRSGSTLAAVSTPALTPLSASAVVRAIQTQPGTKANLDGFSETDWLTIAAVQSHLFPSEPEAPGALEINALSYLHDFLSNPVTDPSEVEFILSGVQSLQTHVRQNQQKAFTDLSIEQREILLREFEKQPDGRRWLVNILNYVLEALLTNPVYGGNPDGIGWEWLEHRAGEPQPPANKRYWLL